MRVTRSLAGGEVHALRWDGADDAVPILLVPGLGGSSVDWQPLGELLAAEAEGTVTALDLPGFGRSRLRQGRAGLDRFTTVVASALDECGPAVVVGNSMGGLIGLRVAHEHPELVTRLVLANPALPARRPDLRSALASLPFLVGTLPVVGPRVLRIRKRLLGAERYVAQRLRNNVHRLEGVDPEVRAALVELTRERLGYREAERVYSDSARSILRTWDAGYRLAGDVEAPTLVVHGRHDPVIPVAVVDRLREIRPDWRFEILDDCGHLPHVEQPRRFADLVLEWAQASVDRQLPGSSLRSAPDRRPRNT